MEKFRQHWAEVDGVARRHGLRAMFDADPEGYDRTRPVCPVELFDDLAALADLRPGSRVVEIGCGTGQATLPLAGRGFQIVGIELGERLAALAGRKLAAFPNVEIVTSSFEGWEASGAPFDAVIAVHAFHWIDPELRYAKPAKLLCERGALALVTSSYVHPEDADPFWNEVQEDYDAVCPGNNDRPPRPEEVGDLRDEIEASAYFRNVAVRRYLWTTNFSADDYLRLLSTSSWHNALDGDARRELFARIRRRLAARPRRALTATLLSTLNVARRR